MKKLSAVLLLMLVAQLNLFAQQYHLTFKQLKEYEGLYEFMSHTRLSMAVSPRDSTLYLIINQARYAIKPSAPDVFLNAQKQPITFLRNSTHLVSGYISGKDTFKILNRKVVFPKEMWYPRLVADPQHYHYKYSIPDALKDGLPVGDVTAAGLDSALLDTMVNKIVAGVYPNVHSVLIIKDGKLVFEQYFYEFTRDSVQAQRSATKSAISALSGIAISQGIIKSVNEKVLPYFPEIHFDNLSELKSRITIHDLLSNQSGVSMDEAYSKAAGNEMEMGYTDDWIKYTFSLPMLDTPGTVGRYNSGNPITMGRIIEKASGMPLKQFAIKNLYGPMGITNFQWDFRPDRSNAENFCQLFLRPRDMAKFGLLYLNGGVWQGKQLVPASWVTESTRKQSVVQGVDYGYLWWLKHLDSKGVRYYGKAAQGNGGQKIYIFSQQQMVVVITGGNYNSQSPSDQLIKTYILPAFNKK